MAEPSCCTCATLLTDVKVPYDPNSEKPLLHNRVVECCSRHICALCQYKNSRFQSYCPFCQISSEPSALPPEGLRLPPSYDKSQKNKETSLRSALGDEPPSYDSLSGGQRRQTQSSEPPQDTDDTIHFLAPDDTLSSLSLAYQVPLPILRRYNKIPSDSLLAAHKWVLIPHSFYSGPPLSTPPDPEEEERKNKVRRWMVATKCADYEVARLYLKGTDWELQTAIEAFQADERWERENPMKGKGKEQESVRRRRGLPGR